MHHPTCLIRILFVAALLLCTGRALAAGPHGAGGNQYRADTSATIPFAGTVPSGIGIYFEANTWDDECDNVRLDVELRKLPATFTGAPNYSSNLVSGGCSSPGARVRTPTAAALEAGTYIWRYRAVDSNGQATNWVSTGNPGFTVVQSGRCCLGTSCSVTTQSNCSGSWTSGANCDGDPCGTTGRCCEGTSCSVTIQANCSGTWTSGGNCNGDPCGTTTGRCCVGTSCSVTTQSNCSGIWTSGENCDGDPCGMITGRCCVGTSCSVTTQANCTGTWTGGGNCNGNLCGATTGRCCVGSSCSMTTQANCSGSWSSGGTCNGNPCDTTIGRCCVGTSCTVTTKSNCSGTWTSGGDCSNGCLTQTCTITTSWLPPSGGTTSGGGVYSSGNDVTVTASMSPGYAFQGWMENGAIVSSNAIYTFPATVNRTLISLFYPPPPDFNSPVYNSSLNDYWVSGNAPASANPPNPQLGQSRGNCTWFAYGRLMEVGFSKSSINCLLGDARVWANRACTCGYGISSVPIPYSIAQKTFPLKLGQTLPTGHVAIVKKIFSDGSFLVDESSFCSPGQSCDFLYKERRASASEFCWFVVPLGYGGPAVACIQLNCGDGKGMSGEDLSTGIIDGSAPGTNPTPPVCGAGICGTGSISMLPVMLVFLVGLQKWARTRRNVH